MKVTILGCGRVGAYLATTLSRSHTVTIIDWNAAAFERLDPSFAGEAVVGNGIDVDVLRRARVADADLFLALTDGDNRNLMASQVARHLGVRRVVVRIYDPVRADIFAEAGLETISPTVTGAQRLFSMVVSNTE